MKVLQIINGLNTGGAEKLLLETLPLYREKGIEMDILVLEGSEYPFMKELEKQNCCTIFSLGNGSVYNPLLILKIIKFFKKYNIVHVHLFPAFYWVVLAKLISFSDVKLVYTEHNTTNRRRLNSFLKAIDYFIYNIYDKIICISKDVEIKLKKHIIGLPDNRFDLINNGLNVSKIFLETSYLKSDLGLNINENDIILIQVSRFQAQKDQSTLIKSLHYLPENVHLLLVGDGILRRKNEELTEKLNLSNRVHFLGVRMDVNKLLKTADIVVLSSHFEGLSLSSIEGLASGKPFVASDVPGLSEIVSGAGVLFPNQDENALAVAINQLIDDKNYYNRIVTQCLIRAKEYDIDIMVEKHINLYNSLKK
jgi:glycosyltransferase involved in cell wall biosynthesis